MIDIKQTWKSRLTAALAILSQEREVALEFPEDIACEIPPRMELGDIGSPLFEYAKQFKMAPPLIAEKLAVLLSHSTRDLGTVEVAGPYINIHLDRATMAAEILGQATIDAIKQDHPIKGVRILIEYSSPNTNKPLHLGHMRNNVLGESLRRILAHLGADVRTINHPNDRGVHICKSMLAYIKLGNNRTPEDEGLKGDHFVGKYYVLFNELKSQDPKSEEEALDLLRRWETGDAEVRALWTRMRQWVLDGMQATYVRTGMHFDHYDFESDTYALGVDEVLSGVERSMFYREADGSIWVNLEDIGLDRKVLLRKDGTSLYITQDIGTAIHRYNSWPYDQLIYVVGSEQKYHFAVLFEVLKRLGYKWAAHLRHLAYGMVNLPQGRMKTREGTTVDADTLLDQLVEMARAEINQKERNEVINAPEVAEKVALAAVHYFLLQNGAEKDMLFNPESSLSFNGNTGPYIQYMCARASSILKKNSEGAGNANLGQFNPDLITADSDWMVLRRLLLFKEAIWNAGSKCDPSILADYVHNLAADFASWYKDSPVLNNPDPDLSASRLAIVTTTLATLKLCCELLCIPFLSEM